METRNYIFLAIILALFVGLSSAAYSETECKDDAVGNVSKISGQMVTVKENSGKEKTVEVRDLKGLKTGDYVIIYDNKIKKINPEKKKGLAVN